MRVKIEAFASEKWPGPDEIARLRIEEKIRVTRQGSKKDYATAEADVDAQSLEEAALAARYVYWRLRTLGVISGQPGGGGGDLLNAEAVDDHGQRHLLPMDVIVVRSDRFFSVTAMVGRLHMLDIGDPASWDPTRITFTRERDIDAILPRMVAAKIRTVGELDAEIAGSQDRPGSAIMYVHEDLLGAARARWERMREDLRAPASDDPTSSP